MLRDAVSKRHQLCVWLIAHIDLHGDKLARSTVQDTQIEYFGRSKTLSRECCALERDAPVRMKSSGLGDRSRNGDPVSDIVFNSPVVAFAKAVIPVQICFIPCEVQSITHVL